MSQVAKWRCSGVFIVTLEHIPHFFPGFSIVKFE